MFITWSTIQDYSGWGTVALIAACFGTTYWGNRQAALQQNHTYDAIDTSTGNSSATQHARNLTAKNWFINPLTYTFLGLSFLCAGLNQLASLHTGAAQEKRINSLEQEEEEIQKKQSGRIISLNNMNDAIEKIKSLHAEPGKVEIIASQCSDCNNFSNNLAYVLKKSGWKVDQVTGMVFSGPNNARISFNAEYMTPTISILGDLIFSSTNEKPLISFSKVKNGYDFLIFILP